MNTPSLFHRARAPVFLVTAATLLWVVVAPRETAAGADPDGIRIVDPDQKTRITEDSLLGKAGYTPYEGWEMDGAITMSLLRGEVLMENGQVVGQIIASGKIHGGPFIVRRQPVRIVALCMHAVAAELIK